MNIQDVTVKTVDKEKLIAFLQIELSENQELSIDDFAVFENLFGIDIDCCFWEIESHHLDSEIQPVVEVPCRIKTLKEGGYSIRMDKPDFVKVIPLLEYLSMAIDVKLTEFIRFNYNPRISANQNLLMKHIRQSRTVSA